MSFESPSVMLRVGVVFLGVISVAWSFPLPHPHPQRSVQYYNSPRPTYRTPRQTGYYPNTYTQGGYQHEQNGGFRQGDGMTYIFRDYNSIVKAEDYPSVLRFRDPQSQSQFPPAQVSTTSESTPVMIVVGPVSSTSTSTPTSTSTSTSHPAPELIQNELTEKPEETPTSSELQTAIITFAKYFMSEDGEEDTPSIGDLQGALTTLTTTFSDKDKEPILSTIFSRVLKEVKSGSGASPPTNNQVLEGILTLAKYAMSKDGEADTPGIGDLQSALTSLLTALTDAEKEPILSNIFARITKSTDADRDSETESDNDKPIESESKSMPEAAASSSVSRSIAVAPQGGYSDEDASSSGSGSEGSSDAGSSSSSDDNDNDTTIVTATGDKLQGSFFPDGSSSSSTSSSGGSSGSSGGGLPGLPDPSALIQQAMAGVPDPSGVLQQVQESVRGSLPDAASLSDILQSVVSLFQGLFSTTLKAGRASLGIAGTVAQSALEKGGIAANTLGQVATSLGNGLADTFNAQGTALQKVGGHVRTVFAA